MKNYLKIGLLLLFISSFLAASLATPVLAQEGEVDLEGVERVPHVLIAVFNALLPLILLAVFFGLIMMIAPVAARWIGGWL